MTRTLPAVAVIADAHFHDLDADFGFPGITVDGRRLTMRSWADTRESTRVFNESADALMAALDNVRRRGIRHVVLLGDYTDDGQRATTETLTGILRHHADEFGMAFYALPGNHDIFGPRGRHHTKQFLAEGGEGVLVTSDPRKAGPGTVVSERMYCEGYPVGLDPMADFGYFRRPEYLHWETPFGASDAVEDRQYEVASPDGRNRYRLMDASYLVEPEPGLWLLMIDANVFEPRDGEYVRAEEAAFIDSTAGGWNAMLRCKPFILTWIADISRRARKLAKTLLAFSHYPALDPFDGTTGAERVLFGETNVAKRTPKAEVEEALVAVGLSLHFSGHLHVEGVTRRGRDSRPLTNVAVPSLVAFPPAFKIVHPAHDQIGVETVELSDLPVNVALSEGYGLETAALRAKPDPAFRAADYGAFLRWHTLALVQHRYFPKEWPVAIAEQVSDLTVGEMCILLSGEQGVVTTLQVLAQAAPVDIEELRGFPLLQLIADWYCLRQGGSLSLPHIGERRLGLYRFLAREFGRKPSAAQADSLQGFLAIFLEALGLFLDRAERGAAQLTVMSNLVREDAVA